MMNGETQEKVICVGLMFLGVVQMFIHPKKTYNLVMHEVGWHN